MDPKNRKIGLDRKGGGFGEGYLYRGNGFRVGIVMSSDPKTPEKSIKNGTINSGYYRHTGVSAHPHFASSNGSCPVRYNGTGIFWPSQLTKVAFIGRLFIYAHALKLAATDTVCQYACDLSRSSILFECDLVVGLWREAFVILLEQTAGEGIATKNEIWDESHIAILNFISKLTIVKNI